MFSRQTAERFEKGKPASAPGPGAYAPQPSALDCRGALIEGTARWPQESASGEYDPSRSVRERGDRTDRTDRDEPLAPPALAPKGGVTPRPASPSMGTRRSLGNLHAMEKENRAPGVQRKKVHVQSPQQAEKFAGEAHSEAAPSGAATPKEPGSGVSTPAPGGASGTSTPAAGGAVASREARQHRHQDLALVSQLDYVREDLKQKTRLLAAKDRRLEELQRRNEELAFEKREAHRKTADAEAERDAKRRQLHDKEQELLSVQRKSEHLRAAIEERSRKLDRKEEELHLQVAEHHRQQQRDAAKQEPLANQERELQAAEYRLHQEQRRAEQVEKFLNEHVAVLEESLRREKSRRRDLEERSAQDSVDTEQGESDLVVERRRADDLQQRVLQLEADMKVKLASLSGANEQRHKLEDEVAALQARNVAQGEALERSERARRELEARLASVEARLESKTRELEAEQTRVADLLQEARHAADVGRAAELQPLLEAAQEKAKSLLRELMEERVRSEELERRIAHHEAGEREGVKGKGLEEYFRQETSTAELEREIRARVGAERDVENLTNELRHWREWADEQSLRELTAESLRLEELRRMREDMTRQVEEAREDVVRENKELHRRLAELESGPEGVLAIRERLSVQEERVAAQAEELAAAQALRSRLEASLDEARSDCAEARRGVDEARVALDVATERAMEERRSLQALAARAEAGVALAEEERAEERVRSQNLEERLSAEHVAALNSMSAKFESARVAEQEAAQLREAELDKALKDARSSCRSLRWRSLVEAASRRRGSAEDAEAEIAMWAQVRSAALQWRGGALRQQREAEQLERQADELDRLDSEAEELRLQNRELVSSLKQVQQELQAALAEMKRLQEREDAYENDLMKASERTAELAGHSNHKQKIHYLASVKAENAALKQELKKAKQSLVQLETQLRSAHFFTDALATTAEASSVPGNPSGGPVVGVRSRTPRRTQDARGQQQVASYTSARSQCNGATCEDSACLRRERAELERQANAHRRASERASNEYQHLAALVEQMLSLNMPTKLVAAEKVASIRDRRTTLGALAGPSTPERRSVGERALAGTSDPSLLYGRLRGLVAHIASGKAPLSSMCGEGNGGDALPAVLTPGKGADSHFASTPERREPDCAREPELEASPPGAASPLDLAAERGV